MAHFSCISIQLLLAFCFLHFVITQPSASGKSNSTGAKVRTRARLGLRPLKFTHFGPSRYAIAHLFLFFHYTKMNESFIRATNLQRKNVSYRALPTRMWITSREPFTEPVTNNFRVACNLRNAKNASVYRHTLPRNISDMYTVATPRGRVYEIQNQEFDVVFLHHYCRWRFQVFFLCEDDWIGHMCDIDCLPHKDSGVYCRNGIVNCRRGWRKSSTHKFCDDVDECKLGNHKCKRNASMCVNQLGSYRCYCKPGYYGKYCEKSHLMPSECKEAADLCQNGGTCIEGREGVRCECVEGYSGRFCEKSTEEICRKHNYCQNGAACLGLYKCACPPGYNGILCEFRKSSGVQKYQQKTSGSKKVPIIIGVILAIVGSAIGAFFLAGYIRRRQQRDEGHNY